MLNVNERIAARINHNLINAVSPEVRGALAEVVAEAIREELGFPPLPTAPEGLVTDLRRQGIVELGPLLSADQTAALRAYLEPMPVYDGHTPTLSSGASPRPRKDMPAGAVFGSHQTTTCLGAPFLMQAANDPRVLTLAESYLGCPPTIYTVSMWWSFPGDNDLATGQFFHRDYDDLRFCVLFLYLSDVLDTAAGPHCYVTESTNPQIMREALAQARQVGHADLPSDDRQLFSTSLSVLRRYHEPLSEAFAARIKTVFGPAGTGFMTDSYGLHRGLPPTSGPRLLCCIRYGQTLNAALTFEDVVTLRWSAAAGRIPDTPYHRYVNRRLFAD